MSIRLEFYNCQDFYIHNESTKLELLIIIEIPNYNELKFQYRSGDSRVLSYFGASNCNLHNCNQYMCWINCVMLF